MGSEKKFIGDKYFIEFEIMFMECRRRVHPQCKTYYYVLEDNHKWIGVIIPAHVLLQYMTSILYVLLKSFELNILCFL